MLDLIWGVLLGAALMGLVVAGLMEAHYDTRAIKEGCMVETPIGTLWMSDFELLVKENYDK